MHHSYFIWFGFVIFITAMLLLDLKVFQRKEHEILVKEALIWTAFWIALALLFNIGIFFFMGHDSALEFLTGYLIEKSLSVDNLFVFLLIFSYFGVSPRHQHKVLFWGIIGAMIMRALFIFAGITLIQKLHWMIYVFGAFLVYIGIKLVLSKETEVHPEKNPVLRLFRRFIPVTKEYVGNNFFIKRAGKIVATPLLVVVIVVETTDVVFAVDSIPAILSITLDPFIVYTSNIFAILGLRALYFAIAGLMKLFRHLNYGLSIILVFVGVKMLISDYFNIPVPIALAVVAGVLATSIIASIIHTAHDKKKSK
jgi:tellurite resistance protein TerC